MRKKPFLTALGLGLALASLVACGDNEAAPLEDNAAGEDVSADPLISLPGSISEVRHLAPPSRNNGPAQGPVTVADVQYFLPCWASMEDGYPKADTDFDAESGTFTIVFNALARDHRKPGEAVCRGLTPEVLKDVFVGSGIIEASKISILNLEIREEISIPEETYKEYKVVESELAGMFPIGSSILLAADLSEVKMTVSGETVTTKCTLGARALVGSSDEISLFCGEPGDSDHLVLSDKGKTLTIDSHTVLERVKD